MIPAKAHIVKIKKEEENQIQLTKINMAVHHISKCLANVKYCLVIPAKYLLIHAMLVVMGIICQCYKFIPKLSIVTDTFELCDLSKGQLNRKKKIKHIGHTLLFKKSRSSMGFIVLN